MLKRALLVLGLACLLLAGGIARAETLDITEARLEASEESYQLAAEIRIELPQRLEEALNKGVPLYFLLELDISKPRWYWFDARPVQLAQTYRLSFDALTRQYRLSAGTLYLSFATLSEALRLLSRPRLGPFEKSRLRASDSYTVSVRMRLDLSQLPRAFQIESLTGREWKFESDWRRFNFKAEASAAANSGVTK